MRKTVITMWLCVVGMVLGASVTGWAAPMGTAFTYQGRLTDQGSPANNKAYDFVFRLYDTSSGMNLLGTDTATNVTPQDGYFKAELDFGSGVFAGEARWLEIDVASAGSGSYTTLSPRQELTPAPYALYALNGPGSSGFWAANGNDIYNSNSGNVGIGTTTPAGRLHVGTAAIYSDIIFFDAGSGQNDLSVDPGSAFTDIIDRLYVVEVTDASGNPDKFKWSDDGGATWSAELAMTPSWYDLNHGVRIMWNNTDGHDDGGGSTGDVWAWVAVRSNENALVVRDGKVGIGTSSPVWELEVANLAAGDGAESAVTADDASGAIAAYSSTLGAPYAHYAGRVSLFSDGATMGLDLRADGSTGDMRFYTGGPWPSNERMRVTSAGGTYLTSYRDDGLGSWEEGLYFANNSNLMGPWSHAGIWADGVSGYNGELVFGVDGDDTNNLTGIQEAMRISRFGNVGIGTPSPGSKLEVVTTGSQTGVGSFSTSGTGVYGSSDSGYGVHGYSQNWYGVYGSSGLRTGVYGIGGTGVYGEDKDTGAWAKLGEGSFGVYTVAGEYQTGVYAEHQLSGNRGLLAGSSVGVEGSSYEGHGVRGSSAIGYAGHFSGNVYVTKNVSALSFTDRTPYPRDLATAYQAVMSMERLPEGQYQDNNKEYQLDHAKLSDFVRSKDGGRDLSATVSALNEVVKDLVGKQQELDRAHTNISQLQKRMDTLEELKTENKSLKQRLNLLEKRMATLTNFNEGGR